GDGERIVHDGRGLVSPACLHQEQAWARTLTWDRAIQKQTSETRIAAGVIQGSVLAFNASVRWRTRATRGPYSATSRRTRFKAWSTLDNWGLTESTSEPASGAPSSRLSCHATDSTSPKRLLISVRGETSRPELERKGTVPTSSRTLLTTAAA